MVMPVLKQPINRNYIDYSFSLILNICNHLYGSMSCSKYAYLCNILSQRLY